MEWESVGVLTRNNPSPVLMDQPTGSRVFYRCRISFKVDTRQCAPRGCPMSDELALSELIDTMILSVLEIGPVGGDVMMKMGDLALVIYLHTSLSWS